MDLFYKHYRHQITSLKSYTVGAQLLDRRRY